MYPMIRNCRIQWAAAAAEVDHERKAGRSRTGTSLDSDLTRRFRSSVSKTMSRRKRFTPSTIRIRKRKKKRDEEQEYC